MLLVQWPEGKFIAVLCSCPGGNAGVGVAAGAGVCGGLCECVRVCVCGGGRACVWTGELADGYVAVNEDYRS